MDIIFLIYITCYYCSLTFSLIVSLIYYRNELLLLVRKLRAKIRECCKHYIYKPVLGDYNIADEVEEISLSANLPRNVTFSAPTNADFDCARETTAMTLPSLNMSCEDRPRSIAVMDPFSLSETQITNMPPLSCGLRKQFIVVDAHDVSVRHSETLAPEFKGRSSINGIYICVNYLKELGCSVVAVVSSKGNNKNCLMTSKNLMELQLKGNLFWTDVDYRRYLLKLTEKHNGFLLTSKIDKFAELIVSNPKWAEIIDHQVIGYQWRSKNDFRLWDDNNNNTLNCNAN